ncbi:PXMP2/4 family protein 4 [Linum grandiflorum]
MSVVTVRALRKRLLHGGFWMKEACFGNQSSRFSNFSGGDGGGAMQAYRTKGTSSRTLPFPPSTTPNSSSRWFSTSSPSKSRFGFIRWYLDRLESRPMLTKAITTSLIYAAADLTAQMIAGSTLDTVRTLRMAGYGLMFLGPAQHLWFNYMSKILPQRDVLSTIKKIFLGQTVLGPANAALFFSYNAALQGESGDEIIARLKRDLLPTLLGGLIFWPMCDFLTFRAVPVHLQVHFPLPLPDSSSPLDLAS